MTKLPKEIQQLIDNEIDNLYIEYAIDSVDIGYNNGIKSCVEIIQKHLSLPQEPTLQLYDFIGQAFTILANKKELNTEDILMRNHLGYRLEKNNNYSDVSKEEPTQEQEERLCENDGTILTSYPPKYRCKRCGTTWLCSDTPTICLVKEQEDTIENIDKLDKMYSEIRTTGKTYHIQGYEEITLKINELVEAVNSLISKQNKGS